MWMESSRPRRRQREWPKIRSGSLSSDRWEPSRLRARPTPHCVEAQCVCRVPTEARGHNHVIRNDAAPKHRGRRGSPAASTTITLSWCEYQGSSAHMSFTLSPAVNLLDDGFETCKVSVVPQTLVGPGMQDVP